jgi:hypothetical protein
MTGKMTVHTGWMEQQVLVPILTAYIGHHQVNYGLGMEKVTVQIVLTSSVK